MATVQQAFNALFVQICLALDNSAGIRNFLRKLLIRLSAEYAFRLKQLFTSKLDTAVSPESMLC